MLDRPKEGFVVTSPNVSGIRMVALSDEAGVSTPSQMYDVPSVRTYHTLDGAQDTEYTEIMGHRHLQLAWKLVTRRYASSQFHLAVTRRMCLSTSG